MVKPESVLKNETHKIIWDFNIQIDYLIPTQKKKIVKINKKKKKRSCQVEDFAILANYRVWIKENK